MDIYFFTLESRKIDSRTTNATPAVPNAGDVDDNVTCCESSEGRASDVLAHKASVADVVSSGDVDDNVTCCESSDGQIRVVCVNETDVTDVSIYKKLEEVKFQLSSLCYNSAYNFVASYLL